MFDLLVNAEGGLTTAGYVVCAIAGIALFVLAILFAGRNEQFPLQILQTLGWRKVNGQCIGAINIFSSSTKGTGTEISMV